MTMPRTIQRKSRRRGLLTSKHETFTMSLCYTRLSIVSGVIIALSLVLCDVTHVQAVHTVSNETPKVSLSPVGAIDAAVEAMTSAANQDASLSHLLHTQSASLPQGLAEHAAAIASAPGASMKHLAREKLCKDSGGTCMSKSQCAAAQGIVDAGHVAFCGGGVDRACCSSMGDASLLQAEEQASEHNINIKTKLAAAESKKMGAGAGAGGAGTKKATESVSDQWKPWPCCRICPQNEHFPDIDEKFGRYGSSDKIEPDVPSPPTAAGPTFVEIDAFLQERALLDRSRRAHALAQLDFKNSVQRALPQTGAGAAAASKTYAGKLREPKENPDGVDDVTRWGCCNICPSQQIPLLMYKRTMAFLEEQSSLAASVSHTASTSSAPTAESGDKKKSSSIAKVPMPPCCTFCQERYFPQNSYADSVNIPDEFSSGPGTDGIAQPVSFMQTQDEVSFFGGMIDAAKSAFKNTANSVKSTVSNFVDKAKSTVKSAYGKVVAGAKNLYEKGKSAVAKVGGHLRNAIGSAAKALGFGGSAAALGAGATQPQPQVSTTDNLLSGTPPPPPPKAPEPPLKPPPPAKACCHRCIRDSAERSYRNEFVWPDTIDISKEQLKDNRAYKDPMHQTPQG
jgi:hypothetical protein